MKKSVFVLFVLVSAQLVSCSESGDGGVTSGVKPLDREHIIGHSEYSALKTDPGELFDWERVMEGLEK